MAFLFSPTFRPARASLSTTVCSSHASVFHGMPTRWLRAPAPLSFTQWSMKSISSNELRPGTTIEIDEVPYRVQEFLHVKPGKGAAFVRTKLKNMLSASTIDKTFKAGEMLQTAELSKVEMALMYEDGDEYAFFNNETMEEERVPSNLLGDDIKFIQDGQVIEMLTYNGKVIAATLPKVLIFKVTETDPGVKGNTASGNALKPATIETGAEVMVPLFINIGEKIKVTTEDGKYAGRSND